jgi:hypothetical protein
VCSCVQRQCTNKSPYIARSPRSKRSTRSIAIATKRTVSWQKTVIPCKCVTLIPVHFLRLFSQVESLPNRRQRHVPCQSLFVLPCSSVCESLSFVTCLCQSFDFTFIAFGRLCFHRSFIFILDSHVDSCL